MNATIIIFPRHCPSKLAPTMPSLATMVVTLQRDHLSELTWREQARLARAAWAVMKGDDADPQEKVEQMHRIHPIWWRIMGTEPNGAGNMSRKMQRILCWLFAKVYRRWLWDDFYKSYMRPKHVYSWRSARVVSVRGDGTEVGVHGCTPCFLWFD